MHRHDKLQHPLQGCNLKQPCLTHSQDYLHRLSFKCAMSAKVHLENHFSTCNQECNQLTTEQCPHLESAVTVEAPLQTLPVSWPPARRWTRSPLWQPSISLSFLCWDVGWTPTLPSRSAAESGAPPILSLWLIHVWLPGGCTAKQALLSAAALQCGRVGARVWDDGTAADCAA